VTTGLVTNLAPVIAARPNRPTSGSPVHPMRIATRRAAFEPDYWTSEEAARVATFFDEIASGWTARFSPEELLPLSDALDRGGPFGARCLEIGAGTGLGTAILRERFDNVVALDLSADMLHHFVVDDPMLVLGDGAHLPVRSQSVDVIVLVNAFLFPAEYDRVLAPGGAIVWLNTLGEDTPIHLPVADVVAALPGEWTAVASTAGWATWGVIRHGR
jgi:SAM-dependent methyltransferase